MRVTLFGYLNFNPYLFLYKKALERQGFIVHLKRKFGLKWLVTKGKSCDAIHLHWIETAYRPPIWSARFGLFSKLINHPYAKPLRSNLRLANFFAALLLAKLQGKTIVYTVHNLSSHDVNESWSFVIRRRIAHHIVLSLSDHIHAHNHYTRKTLKSVYNRKFGVIVVPLGNYISYYPNQTSRLEARRQLNLPADAFVYLFMGRIRPYKGVEELIDAFKKLKLSKDQLLIVGRVPDDYQERIASLSRNNPAIKLVPEFVPDEAVQLYMNACDICVLPYKNITTSSAAVLALSFGRPVIAPALTSFPELITPETGILYDPTEPNALVSALQQARQQSWSESKIFDYVRQFDWDKLGSQLANLYLSPTNRL